MTGYVWLTFAIVAEVVATSSLKAAAGFTRLGPSVVVVLGYAASFYCLSMVLKSIPVAIAYAIWAGLGTALITVVGAWVLRQTPDLPALIGIALIVAGVVVINLFSKTVSH